MARHYLIEAGAALASSLDLASTMRQFVELLVPGCADLCVIDLVGETGAIEGLAAAASLTGLADELGDVRRRFPIDRGGEHPVARVIRTGEPEFQPEISKEFLRTFAHDPTHAQFIYEPHPDPQTRTRRSLG
jgi:hypothetical protein